MDHPKNQYRESLTAHLSALEVARKMLQGNEGKVPEMVRRVAHSLWSLGNTFGINEIVFEAAALQESDDAGVPLLLDYLIAKLSILNSSGEPDQLGILIVEDDEDAAKILKAALSTHNRHIHHAASISDAMIALVEKAISLIILDLHLPDTDGRNFLLHLRSTPSRALLPVIILTSSVEAEAETECLALGADIFFQKPYDLDTLAVAVASRLQRVGDFTRQARQDLLTGLPNRASFAEIYSRNAALSARRKEPLSICMLDLDHFKLVNDTYGHGIGDEVLRRLASVLTNSLRRSDVIARWGGEEFTVLLPHTATEGAVRAMEKGLEALREVEFKGGTGQNFRVTFSAGVALVAPGMHLPEAIAEADRIMYLAKSQGRNRVTDGESTAPGMPLPEAIAEADRIVYTAKSQGRKKVVGENHQE